MPLKSKNYLFIKLPFQDLIIKLDNSPSDFFKKLNKDLTEADYQDIFTNGESFKSAITNKNWYFLGWKYDLTIQSAITKLNEIHPTFNETNIKLSDLTNEEKPPVVPFF